MLNQLILVGKVKEMSEISDKDKNTLKMNLELEVPGRDKNTPSELVNVKVGNAIGHAVMEHLQINDVVGIKGRVKRNENNELEIITDKLTFLSSARHNEEQENEINNNEEQLER